MADTQEVSTLPLAGVRVVEFTHMGMAPGWGNTLRNCWQNWATTLPRSPR